MTYAHTKIYLLLIAVFGAHATSLRAQAAPELLETLIVSGVRSADANVSRTLLIKTAEDFSAGARLDPAELLQNIPGVQVDSRTNYAQDTRISLRGFGARSAFGVRGIDLQVDGIPMSTPDGQGQLASVMLDNIASVQVLRGPIAALYGNGAGGVIALQSAAPELSSIKAGFGAGDPGLARQTLNGEWRSDNFAMRAQFANTDIDGERPHSSAERQQAGVQLFYTTENNLDLIVKHDYADDPRLQDPLGLTPAQWRNDPWQLNPAAETYDTRKTVEHQQSSISLRDNNGATRWQTGLWQGERAITQYLGRLDEIVQQCRTQRDFIALQIHEQIPWKHTRHCRHPVGACLIVSGHHDDTSPELLDCLLDAVVVGRHQYIRNGPARRSPFIHVLDHRLAVEHDQRLSWKSRRAIPRGNDHHDGTRGTTHLPMTPSVAWERLLPSLPCRPRSQPHDSPGSPHV